MPHSSLPGADATLQRTPGGLIHFPGKSPKDLVFVGRFYMALAGAGRGRGALKVVQTVSLRSLPVARLAAGTLAFHGLIRSRLGRLGAWPRTCRTLVSIRQCSDQTAATTHVNGRASCAAGPLLGSSMVSSQMWSGCWLKRLRTLGQATHVHQRCGRSGTSCCCLSDQPGRWRRPMLPRARGLGGRWWHTACPGSDRGLGVGGLGS